MVYKLLTILCLLTSGLQAVPNFLLENNSHEPLHFIVLGVNDLFGLRNGTFEEPCITTLEPGKRYLAEIGLSGVLPKPPQIVFYPNPQGQQQTLSVHFNIARHKHTLDMPIGSLRIYLFNTTQPIEVEIAFDGTLRSLAGSHIKQHEIVRSHEFEKLATWTSNPKNHKKFCKFQQLVYPFVYEYIKAGSIRRFLWNWPLQGLIWALQVKWAESSFRKKTGIKLLPKETIDWYIQELRR